MSGRFLETESIATTYAISCVLPCYNVAPYIKQCLDSVLAQSLPDGHLIQIIVVNDGSTDDTGTILRRYKEQYPDRIELIEQSNQGLGPARNSGFAAVRGKYVCFIDSDDCLASSSALYSLFLVAERSGEYIVGGNFMFYHATAPERNTVAFPQKSLVKVALEKKYARYLEIPMIMAKLYRVDFYRRHGFVFENTWAEDQLFYWQSVLAGHGLMVVPEVTYLYRQREDSLSKIITLERIETLADIRVRQFAMLDNTPDLIDSQLLSYLHYSYLLEMVRYLFALPTVNDVFAGKARSPEVRELVARVHRILQQYFSLRDPGPALALSQPSHPLNALYQQYLKTSYARAD